MFNHSLEHLTDHFSVLRKVRHLLGPNGACLVRIPLADSNPMRKYGIHWVEWDPPRHVIIHSEESFRHLVERSGFDLASQRCDGEAFSYWASELYSRAVPLVDAETGRFRDPNNYFSPDDIISFQKEAESDNSVGSGSRAIFWIL